MTTPSRVPFVAIVGIVITMTVFGLFAITIGAGIWTFVLFVLVVVAVLFVGGALYRIYVSAWLQVASMNYKREDMRLLHERSMAQLQARAVPQLPQSTSAAPVLQAQRFSESFTDPARDIALLLLSGTIQSATYGPDSKRIMTQADAKTELDICADDWSAARAFLCSYYDVESITDRGRQNGLYAKRGKTVTRILTDTAVMSLPTAPPR